MYKNIKIKGFTLIELLVVIAIISLLSSIVIASLTSAKVRANNTRRMADIKQIKTAVNLYANDNFGTYPAGVGCLNQATGTKCWNGYSLNAGGSGINALPALDAALSPYMSIPKDPKPNRSIGDRYIYFNGIPNLHCSNTPENSIPGAYIAFMPEKETTPTDAECEALGATTACCGVIGCGAPNFCVTPLN
jgi:prepilin-type N-terminal cleavage/methylation domain-containing protein